MSSAPDAAAAAVVHEPWLIEPTRSGLGAAARELWAYRRLFIFFSVQGIKALYEGTSLGIFWLFARPLLPVLISTFVFGSLLQISSNGVPYFLFMLTGNSVWMLFDRSLLWATRSLDSQRAIIKKLYFPRQIVPVAAVAPALVYFGIYMTLIVLAAFYYLFKDGRWYLAIGPGWLIAFAVAALAIVMAVALGFFTAVWQTRFREVRYGLRYVMMFWFYLTPVIYPMSQVPPHLQWVIYLNPMASIVETFKWGLLGVGSFPVLPLLSSLVVLTIVFAAGLWYFSRSEAASVDQL
jgi:lipopolysaccharide transport system permease protein